MSSSCRINSRGTMLAFVIPLLLFAPRAAYAFQSTTRFQTFLRPFGTVQKYKLADTERETFETTTTPVDFSIYDFAVDSFQHRRPLPVKDPALVDFTSAARYQEVAEQEAVEKKLQQLQHTNSNYPIATMMQCSAPYIASHLGKTAVIHLPGDLLDRPEANSLLSDLALSWLLGMKLVIVVGCRYSSDTCDVDQNLHECQNALRVTTKETLRKVEEDAGYLRTEIERKLNRFLRLHGSLSTTAEGNVVSGNFYTAQRFGRIRETDFEYTGYTASVNVKKINQVLADNDVLLLTTVGPSAYGELVDVNGYHLAASVASALDAHKLIYLANEGSVLQKKDEERTLIQELPLSFAKTLTDYHKVKVFNTGFATFEQARKNLESCAVELLIHLGWASWALEHGVTRAHIINPTDGALLEELFTSKNGANTCLYHDDENKNSDHVIAPEEWDEFFDSAAAQGQDVRSRY